MRQANGLVLALLGIAVVTMAFRGSLKNTFTALMTPDVRKPPTSSSSGNRPNLAPAPQLQPGAPGSGVPTG